MKLAFEQVDSGKTTWAATKGRAVYGLDKGKWRRITTGNHVTSGDSGVWLIRGSAIYFRTGIRKNRRLGLRWKRIPGGLKQIDSGPKGVVCGLNSGNNIYCRLGISSRVPWGKRWLHIPGKLKYISCGDYGHWGVNRGNKIYFRIGVTRSRPAGIRWKYISGRLTQIEAGQYGQVFGVNARKQLYVRLGVTEHRPWGRRWKKIKAVTLWSYVTVGKGVLFALSARKTLYRSNLGAVSGKLPHESISIYSV
jgi:hypothetical protein